MTLPGLAGLLQSASVCRGEPALIDESAEGVEIYPQAAVLAQ